LNNATAGWVKIQYIQRTAVSRDGRSASAYSYKWAPRAAQTKAQLPMRERERECVCGFSSPVRARPEKGNWSGVNSRGTPDTALLEIELSLQKGRKLLRATAAPNLK